ncbi:transcription factor DIVARICATA-like [Apium graveolens]|uniref:transcription factor DIVARICATA-like n=2 Tax=Apium graveolens TaxID=4045 RepID=UPI003D78E365
MEELFSKIPQQPNENDVYTSDGWTFKDNKLYENTMAEFEDYGSAAFFQRVAVVMPWKTMASIQLHHEILMEELNWIKLSNGEFEDIVIEENGHFDDIVLEDTMGEEEVIEQVNQQTSRPNKRGVPWTMEEHWAFMRGVEECGKGDWKNISQFFVSSRTPAQVASHAQKFFKRMQKTAAEKHRTTINDIQCFCCNCSPCKFGSSVSLARSFPK